METNEWRTEGSCILHFEWESSEHLSFLLTCIGLSLLNIPNRKTDDYMQEKIQV